MKMFCLCKIQFCLFCTFSSLPVITFSTCRVQGFFLFAFPGSANQNVARSALSFFPHGIASCFLGFYLEKTWGDLAAVTVPSRLDILNATPAPAPAVFLETKEDISKETLGDFGGYKSRRLPGHRVFWQFRSWAWFSEKRNYGQRKLGKIIETNLNENNFYPPFHSSFSAFSLFRPCWFYSLNEKHKKDYSCRLWGQHMHSKHSLPITHVQYHLMLWIPSVENKAKLFRSAYMSQNNHRPPADRLVIAERKDNVKWRK